MMSTKHLLSALTLAMACISSSSAEVMNGGSPLIFGNTYISTGAGAKVYGDILANTYLVTGASTVIEGDIQTGAAVTTGATTDIVGDIKAGAAITLGASTDVSGDVCHGAALTLGASAEFENDNCSFDAMIYTSNDVIAAQNSYNALTANDVINRNQLNPTISGNQILNPGDGLTTTIGNIIVYNATSLTTTAGITLTLYGDYDWVFNIDDILSFGAGTKVVLADGNTGSVTWNVGGYASVGADAEIIGAIFANGYISTGVRATVTDAVSSSQPDCRGLLSATSYVTIGANSTVSCEQTAESSPIDPSEDPVSVPNDNDPNEMPTNEMPIDEAKNTPLIFGNTYISTGANAKVYGDISANTYLVTGANTAVKGNIKTGAAVTTGAATGIVGNIRAGTAITLGATTNVDGNVCHGTALTQGAGAKFTSVYCPVDTMTYTKNDVIAAQDSYNALTPVNVDLRNQLNPTMSIDSTLMPLPAQVIGNTVVYNATSLTTAAGITLNLIGDYDWVFNIRDILSFGAGTKVVLDSGSTGSVTWNVAGYSSIGAGAEIIGTILADGYISTGAYSKVTRAASPSVSSNPAQSYCGGLLSATQYVTIGANSSVSCE
jgi:cytoskeletal protein CcmA (bactofilin family)